MKHILKPIVAGLLATALVGCSLLSSSATPTPPIAVPPISPSGYEPQPGDEKLTRGEVFIDFSNSSLALMESFPVQVSAILNGNLPDPCHQLRAIVNPITPFKGTLTQEVGATSEKKVNLEVYSLTDPSQVCITVVKPFNATISLGSYPTGHYSVYVNGKLLGEFDA
jgi:hypothetical protein